MNPNHLLQYPEEEQKQKSIITSETVKRSNDLGGVLVEPEIKNQFLEDQNMAKMLQEEEHRRAFPSKNNNLMPFPSHNNDQPAPL